MKTIQQYAPGYISLACEIVRQAGDDELKEVLRKLLLSISMSDDDDELRGKKPDDYSFQDYD